MLVPPVAAQWYEGAGLNQGPAAPGWLPEVAGAQAASCPVGSTHVHTPCQQYTRAHTESMAVMRHPHSVTQHPAGGTTHCPKVSKHFVMCVCVARAPTSQTQTPGQCVSTRLTMIAFNSTSHFSTLWPLKRVIPSSRGQPLDVLGRSSLSLTALQGVGRSPVSSGIPACLMSHVAKFWTKPAADERSDGCRPEPNCAEQQQAGCVLGFDDAGVGGWQHNATCLAFPRAQSTRGACLVYHMCQPHPAGCMPPAARQLPLRAWCCPAPALIRVYQGL